MNKALGLQLFLNQFMNKRFGLREKQEGVKHFPWYYLIHSEHSFMSQSAEFRGNLEFRVGANRLIVGSLINIFLLSLPLRSRGPVHPLHVGSSGHYWVIFSAQDPVDLSHTLDCDVLFLGSLPTPTTTHRPLIGSHYLFESFYILSSSTVGNQEQAKQKIPRRSFSILPMLPHQASPRRIRSVKTLSFWFLIFLPLRVSEST